MGNGRGSGLPKGVKNTSTKVKNLLGKNDTVVKRFRGTEKNVDKSKFQADYLKDANPNRDKWHEYEKWRQNCQRACYATDLRLAGYNVEALARLKSDTKNGISLADSNYADSFLNVYKDGAKNFEPLGGSTDNIMNKLEKLLPNSGARAIVHNYWEGGGGHAWNLIRIGNNIYGIDGQTNKMFDPVKYISRTTNFSRQFGSTRPVSGKHCINVLVTNLGNNTPDLYTPTDLLHKFVKNRKKRGK